LCADGQSVVTNGVAFPIAGGIPVMLDVQTRSENYVEHYQTDAQEFDYFEEREDPATEHDERRVREAILSRLPTGTSAVLDVGCGRAWVARDLCPRGITVCSMDVSLTNPKRALEKYPSDNHCALVADAFALPFADRSIDLALPWAQVGLFVLALLAASTLTGVLSARSATRSSVLHAVREDW
jgi:SAM-dependent methyltransferase